MKPVTYRRFLKVPGSLVYIFHFTGIARNRTDASIRFNILTRFRVE